MRTGEHKAVFVDRNCLLEGLARDESGEINPLSVTEFKVRAEAKLALSLLKTRGFKIIVTATMPEVTDGQLSRREADIMHDRLRVSVPVVDDILSCFHNEEDHCPCRAPLPGHILEASHKWNLKPGNCFMVSRRSEDVDAARAAGCVPILIGDTKTRDQVESLSEAVNRIISSTS